MVVHVLLVKLEDFREDIPHAVQYVNSDGVLQQCILCRLEVAICLQSVKSGEFQKIFSKHLYTFPRAAFLLLSLQFS